LLDEIEKAPYERKALSMLTDRLPLFKGSLVCTVFGQKWRIAHCLEVQTAFLELYREEKTRLEMLIQKAKQAF
jgi:hypothetical protein